jgi:hypothetical protein
MPPLDIEKSQLRRCADVWAAFWLASMFETPSTPIPLPSLCIVRCMLSMTYGCNTVHKLFAAYDTLAVAGRYPDLLTSGNISSVNCVLSFHQSMVPTLFASLYTASLGRNPVVGLGANLNT